MDPSGYDKEGQGARPQVPSLEALATVLLQEAFTAIQAVLSNLDQRISAVESSIVTPQHLQNNIHSALSNTHFTVNASWEAPPTQIPARLDPPEITLSPLSGSQNIRLWISMTEDSMLASQVPRDNWTYYVAPDRDPCSVIMRRGWPITTELRPRTFCERPCLTTGITPLLSYACV